jgi:hypothetical protein
MPRLDLLSIHGLSMPRLFSRMSWRQLRAAAASRGFDQTRSKSFIGKLTPASDDRRSFDRGTSRHGGSARER